MAIVAAEKYWLRRQRYQVACVMSGVGMIGCAQGAVRMSEVVLAEWSDAVGILAIAGLLVMTGLAVFCGQRAWVNGRLAEKAAAELTPSVLDDAVDPDKETQRLTAVSLRLTGYTAGCVLLAAASVDIVLSALSDGNEDLAITGLFALFLSLFGAGFGLYATMSWRRRYQAVLATGWRPATVTIKPDYDSNTGGMPWIFDVRFPDGERVRLQGLTTSFRSATRFMWRPDIRVLVGGEGEFMVLLFSRGPAIPPRAVPVREFVRTAS